MDNSFVKGDYVFLLERHSISKTSDNDYVFEGICAKFGIQNENLRTYDRDDYLPHLTYLNNKISKKSLLGELDHPKDYEVSLQNASHIVEKLWYNDKDDTVRIRIRLLNGTPNGELAKSLVNMGVPLAISSRAVGQILESKKVRLQRIFTYDLVAEPGFSEAVLNRSMNESYNPVITNLNEQYEKMKPNSLFSTRLTNVNEQLNFSDGIKIYKINDTDEVLSKFKIDESSENNKEHMAKEQYVNSTDFNDFTEVTKGEISGIKTILSQINDSLKVAKKLNEDAAQEIPGMQAQEEAQTQDAQAVQAQTQEAETTELENITPEDDQSTMLKKLMQYVEYLSDQVKVIMDHGDIVTENLNKVIAYSQNIGLAVNEHVNHTNLAFNTVNDAINYMQFIGKIVNRIDEGQDKLVKYANEHTKVINEMILYGDYNSNLVGNVIEHTNYLANVLRSSELVEGKTEKTTDRNLTAAVDKLAEGKEPEVTGEKVNEGAITAEPVKATVDTITEKVDNLIATINLDRVENVLEARHPFLKLLNEDDKKQFYGLDSNMKAKIVGTLNSSVYFSREDVVNVFNAVINESVAHLPNYIKLMPDKFKPILESMSEQQKRQLNRIAESKIYKLNTPYQVKMFWESQDFSGVKTQINNEKMVEKTAIDANKNLNESQSKEGYIEVAKVKEGMRGYSNDYLENLRNIAKNRK